MFGRMGGMGRGFGRLGGTASGLLLPAAPALTIVEPGTNPPAFDVDLPSGNDNTDRNAAVGDTLRVQITLATDTGFASVVDEATVVLDSDDLTADVIEVAGLDTLDADDYIARARLERPDVGNSAWSATTASFEVPAAVTKSYTFREIFAQAGSGSGITRSVEIGTASADRLVIVGLACQNATNAVSVTVNGVSLSEVSSDEVEAGSAHIWAGVVNSGDGAQSIVATWGSAFLARSIAVWTATGLDSTTAVATAIDDGTMSVQAGDFLFSMAQATTTAPSMAGYTQAPTEHTTTGGTSFGFTAGDATISSTNASFGTTISANAAASAVWR